MFLETVTGKLVDVIDPHPDQIDINDIAWGLSRQPRFAGHTITEIPYNVAQHSLMVADLVQEMIDGDLNGSDDEVQKAIKDVQSISRKQSTTTLKALLHDAAEVYIGDIPSPVKKHPQIYKAVKDIEWKLMKCIFLKYDIPDITEAENVVIHHADMIARAIEAHAFMQSRGRDWKMPEVSLIRLQKFEPPMTSVLSYQLFLERFNELY
jgi:5'-deoxynucleotidase YfbR-like HD superfamily hydrolase